MKIFAVAALLLASTFGQPGFPIFLGPTINFLPPAVDATGRIVAFGSTVTPQGGVQNTIDLYIGSTKIAAGVTSVGLTSDGSRAVFTDVVSGGEGVGTVDTSTGSVRRLNVDTQGCIRPLALCISCFFACVVTPHATAEGSKVLFAVRRNQPFFVINSDGTGLTQLPVYSGELAPSPQRVIGANGRVVFTSPAPFGPTFAASATDVYTMNPDGTNIHNLTNFGSDSTIFSSNATISADGTTVAFETNYAGVGSPPGQETQIWAVQSDGSGLRELTFGPGAATSPSISADGKRGVFVQAGLLNILQPFVDLQPHGLRISIAGFRYSVPQSAAISDDGQRVVFLVGPTEFSAGAVYQVNADGSGLHALYAPRAISPRGVVSAAGLGLSPSPGGLVSVYGINFSGDSITSADRFPLPLTLGGASVLIDGTQVPMLGVSTWQINAQLPQELPAQGSKFQASFADGAITPPEVAGIVTAAPALFVIQLQRGGVTVYQAAAFHAGTAIPADDDHPAHAGEALEMYGTGLGATDPAVPAGQPSPGNPPVRAKVQPLVRIGNVEARVLFAGLTPGLAGVGQVNIVVPDGLKPGRYVISLQSGNANTGALGTIAVQ
jgi:uncharacterized protein (TIGR03437 family)